MLKSEDSKPGDDERFLDSRLLQLDFDQYQRYRRSAELIQSLLFKNPNSSPISLLEVGSNVLDLFPSFLSNLCHKVIRCDVVDVEGVDPRFVKLTPGKPLPFEDNSFQVVAALDVLEHMHPEERLEFIRDCVRVSSGMVLLTFPCGGPDVVHAESILRTYLQNSFGGVSPFLEEHIQFGLPTPAELKHLLGEIGLQWRYCKNSPLPNWLGLNLFSNTFAGRPDYGLKMLSLFNEFYNRSFYRKDFSDPGYRAIYIIDKQGGLFDNVQVSWENDIRIIEQRPSNLVQKSFEVMVQVAAKYHLDIQTELARLTDTAVWKSISDKDGRRDLRSQMRHYEHQISAIKHQIATGGDTAKASELNLALEDARGRLEVLRKLAEFARKKSTEVYGANENVRHIKILEATIAKNRGELQDARRSYERLAQCMLSLFFNIRANPSGAAILNKFTKMIEKKQSQISIVVNSSTGLINVTEGHSLWCFIEPGAILSWRTNLHPGRYYFKTRAVSSEPVKLVLKYNGENSKIIGTLSNQPADYVLRLDVEQSVNEFTLSLDRHVPFAAIGDFHVVREDREVVLDAVKRNSVRLAQKYALLPGKRETVSGQNRKSGRFLAVTSQGIGAFSSWMENRLRERSTLYPPSRTPGILSLLTCAWNTPQNYLDVLTHSVLNQQDCPNFEWVVLDNGSTSPQTVSYLQDLKTRKNVKYFRAEKNLGIIGGMRFCLEKATGRYVLPLDSDDFLYPDCLKIMAYFIEKNGSPPLLYSDEDMLTEDQFHTAYLKPDWDPVLFLNSCYIAHLCAINRELALQYGVYTDPQSEGCHDWDTFIRFMTKGHQPLHVPEVIYSWRNHPASTASNITSKSYISSSHKHVLGQYLKTKPNADRYRIESSPLFNATPDWWFRRSFESPRDIVTVVLSRDPAQVLAEQLIDTDYPAHRLVIISLTDGIDELHEIAQSQAKKKGLVHLMYEDIRMHGDEWTWEALTLTELHPDIAMIGGRVIGKNKTILAAGEYFGCGGDCACPDIGRPANDSGYFSQMWKQRSVSAVSSMLAIVDAAFLAEFLESKPQTSMTLPFLGAWLGAHAAKNGKRVVYTPHLTGRCYKEIDWYTLTTREERDLFVKSSLQLLPDKRYYGRLLSLDFSKPYTPVSARERETQESFGDQQRKTSFPQSHSQTHYTRWLELQIENRGTLLNVTPAPGQFSILTTVYNTPPEYLEEAAESLFSQTGGAFEWILLDNGSTQPEVIRSIRNIAKDSRVKYSRVSENLGIMGGMKLCLSKATGEYVVPLDADDLLTPDALQVLAQYISSHGSPEYLYSDEDMLVGHVPQSEYLRPDWDPVLNLCTSYIFHLCAFKRAKAIELDVYSDMDSTWCHDWDTVFRFAAARTEMVHVPEILYHWRMHPQSSTARPDPEKGSMVSQKHLLQKYINRQPKPDLYKVELFPISRGAPEWWIRRLPIEPEPIQVVLCANSLESAEQSLSQLLKNTNYPFSRVVIYGASSPLTKTENWRVKAENLQRELLRLHQLSGTRITSVSVELIDEVGLKGMAQAIKNDFSGLTLVYSTRVIPLGQEWPWEALALYRLHENVVLFSGRIINIDRIVVAGGEIFGFNGLVGSPEKGRPENDPGYKAMALKQRSVSAVNPDFFLADTAFLRKVFKTLPESATLGFLGAWLGGRAADDRARVVFTPLITGSAPDLFTGDQTPSAEERVDFLARYSALIPDYRWYSRHFKRDLFSFHAIDYSVLNEAATTTVGAAQ